jgi:branched-chain amino acid transport system permease protein
VLPSKAEPSAEVVAQPRSLLSPRAVAALIGLLCFLPLFLNDYTQFVANTMLVYCLVATGFNIVLGYLGQLAFANAAFFGIGAYAASLGMVHGRLPFLAAMVLGGLAGAAAGALVALPALRVKGYYLAIITLAFGELMRWTYIHGDAITFGSGGFNVPAPSVMGWALTTETEKFYLFLAIVTAGIGATARLLRSRFGRAFVAIRNNEMAAAALGIPIARTKIIAFAWSGLMVGLAGTLYAILNGRVTPESFGLSQILLDFAIVMIGGLGSILGSVLGAVLLTGAPEFLRNLPGVEEIVFSLLLIIVLLVMPKGIGGFLADRFPALREPLHR